MILTRIFHKAPREKNYANRSLSFRQSEVNSGLAGEMIEIHIHPPQNGTAFKITMNHDEFMRKLKYVRSRRWNGWVLRY